MTPIANIGWRRLSLLIGGLFLTGCGLLNPIPGPDLTHLRALVWNETAEQILWTSGGSTPITQVAIPQTGHTAALCRQSSDGRMALIAYGDAREHLTLLNSDPSSQPMDLGETDPRSCLSGHSMFSTDNTRLVYLSYAAQTAPTTAGNVSGLAVGTLNMVNLPVNQPRTLLDQVAAFDLHSSALFAVSGSGSGLTAQQWTLSSPGGQMSTPKPIGTAIMPTAGCTWVDAQIRAIGIVADTFDRLLVALGESCGKPTGETVHLFSILLTNGSATEIYHQSVNGTYDSNRSLSALATTPDAKTAYLAVPNGQTTDLSDIIQIDLTNPPQFAPTAVGGLYVTRSALNAAGTQWGIIILNPGGGETLEILDLTHPEQSAVTLTDNNRSSLIPAMSWSQSGKRLIYAYTGNNSALGYLDLNGALASVLPGKFQFSVTDSAGKVALTVKADSGDLLAVAIPGGGTQTLIAGKTGIGLIPLALVQIP